MIGNLFNKLLAHHDLTVDESKILMDLIMDGEATGIQIAGILTALRMKQESIDEISGMAISMRNHATRINPRNEVLDTCGTGGDSSHSFNISTTAAFIAAASGVNIAKHGNRNVSSLCGCADLLEELGVNINLSPLQVETSINETGFGFMFAPKFHLAMKHAMTPRKELGIRTIFNILGPLTNPANAKFQLLGVFKPNLTETMAHVLKNLGTKKALVVHGLDGLDELSLSAPTRITELSSGTITTYDFNPETLGFTFINPSDITGGDKAVNALITRSILSGAEKGPKFDVALINAAAALLAANKVENLKEGVALARKTLANGAAMDKLNQLIKFTRSQSD